MKGWTLAAIGELLPSLPDDVITAQIAAEAAGTPVSWVGGAESATTAARSVSHHRNLEDVAEEAVVLLAQGILRQYESVPVNEIETLCVEI